MTEKMNGVVGFLFNSTGNRVVLIRKNRPAWQAGKLNGVGGHIEQRLNGVEKPHEAMTREFQEEAGYTSSLWEHYVSLTGDWGKVHFFRNYGDIDLCSTKTDEEVEIHYVHNLVHLDVIPNLRWLIPLALHRHDSYAPIEVHEYATR